MKMAGRNQRWFAYGKGLRSTARFGTTGLEMALSVGLGYLVGDYLDGKAGTRPWLMLAGVLLGTVAGFVNLWRAMKAAQRSDRKAD
jgi:F0F1-type ATP synthase assembly protein I